MDRNLNSGRRHSSLNFRSLALFLQVLLTACGPREGEASYPFVARIISSEQGVYRLSNVVLSTLEDIRTVRGSVGQMRGNASLRLNQGSEEIKVSSDPDLIYEDRGRAVQIDYLLKGGVIVPQNIQSMEMLGLYYNLERTIAFWSSNFDISFDEIGLPGILYNPKSTSEKSGVKEELAQVMNAAYIPGVKDLWFFKTSPREKVPVKMNFGVVAHEFGHFIFDYRFASFDPSIYTIENSVNERALSGLNEGLADFFAYMVSGSPREFGNSLPQLAEERNLPVNWTWNSLPEADCQGGYYCEGSILASALYEIANLPEQNALKVGRLIYATLPLFAARWKLYFRTENLDYHLFLNSFLETAGSDQVEYCRVLQKWFNSEPYRDGLACS